MTIKWIKIFVTVYQEESVTGAARKLKMTQPATSLAIRELEDYFNTKLFERSGRGIRPTEAARHFYPSAVRFLSLYEEMDDEMKNWNQTGKLRIGSSISIGSCILPQLMKKFTKKYSDLDIYVKIDSSDVIEQNILENHLDIALIEGTVHSDKLQAEIFMDDELIPVCGRFHPFADRETPITLEELKKEHFLMREENSGTRELAESCLKVNGFLLHPAWESTSTAALINGVSAGLGISILPKRMLEHQLQMHQLFPFQIEGMNFTRHYYLIYHKNKYLSPVIKEFFEMTQDFR